MLDSERDRHYADCLEQAMQASQAGRLDEALSWLDEALRVHPHGADAHNVRGEILWDQGRSEEALAEFGRAVEIAPDLCPAHLNQVEILIEEFQAYEEALELCDILLQSSLEPTVEAETYYLKSKSLFYLDDLDGALFLLRRAIRVNGEQAMYHGFEGQILFELGRFGDARRSLERSRALEPDAAHTTYHLALVFEHLGDFDQADRCFGLAEELQPDAYPKPVRMPLDEFERVAEEALRSLPQEIRRYVRNCPVLIEDLPDGDLVRGDRLSPQLLGIFMGTPATEPGASPTLGTQLRTDVDKVILFKRNLEKMAASRAELIVQIQITVKHEIGHYLGLDEDELDRLGLG